MSDITSMMNGSYTPIDDEDIREHFPIRVPHFEDEVLTESEMWSAIERDVGALPVYLKNILSINGYNHLLSLEELDEEAIRDIEKFTQESLKQYVPTTEDYFSIFKKNPSDFRIVSGHRKLLIKLRDRIRQNGVTYYMQLKSPPMMHLKPEQLFYSPEDSPMSPSDQKPKRRKRNHIPEIYSEEDKIRLLVFNWFNKYTEVPLEMPNIGSVVCDAGDKIYGVIVCPVCNGQVKIGAEKNKNGSNRWIISNYVKHFQKYHTNHFNKEHEFKIELN